MYNPDCLVWDCGTPECSVCGFVLALIVWFGVVVPLIDLYEVVVVVTLLVWSVVLRFLGCGTPD